MPIHEIQHAIQSIEEFESGADPAMFILKHELTHSIEKAGKDFERFIADVEISEAFEEYAKTKTNSQTGENFNSIDEWYNDIIYK